jgi:DNA-binding FrmR family transcriptional regulator
MAHLRKNTDALVLRVRRIVGQLHALERELEAHQDCSKTLHLTAAVRGAVNGLMDELIEAHVTEHVAAPELSPEARSEGADSLLAAIRRYAK